MSNLINTILHRLRVIKHRKYIQSQVNLGMEIGINVGIMPGVNFDPPHSFLITIGDNCIIAPNVRFLNHDASSFLFTNSAKIGKIVLKENCFIGAGSTLLPGIEIGPNVIIGAGSVVTKNIPPNSIAVGNPAAVIDSIKHILNEKRMEGKFCIQSKELYPKINNKKYIAKIKEEIGLFGFTIGSDKNYDYFFNIRNVK